MLICGLQYQDNLPVKLTVIYQKLTLFYTSITTIYKCHITLIYCTCKISSLSHSHYASNFDIASVGVVVASIRSVQICYHQCLKLLWCCAYVNLPWYCVIWWIEHLTHPHLYNIRIKLQVHFDRWLTKAHHLSSYHKFYANWDSLHIHSILTTDWCGWQELFGFFSHIFLFSIHI